MRIASITIFSDTNADSMANAFRSCHDQVDAHLVISFGAKMPVPDDAAAVAGDKLIVSEYDGDVRECGALRNLGLDTAHDLGFDWAMTLDADEEMRFGETDVKAELEKIGSGVVVVPFDIGPNSKAATYRKERFFSLPIMDRFSTVLAHECVPVENSKQSLMDSISFWERPKSPEALHGKLTWLLSTLEQEVDAEGGKNPRTWYYLGDTLQGLGRDKDALMAFDKCSALRGWDEESAWACFRMATLLESMGRLTAGIDVCCAGLARFPGMSELAWFAGHLSHRLGEHAKAIHWCEMALAVGDSVPRIGWSLPYGMKEGPYETMRDAYLTLGMPDQAMKCIHAITFAQ